MSFSNKNRPKWIELNIYLENPEEIDDLRMKYELILDPRNYSVCFFGGVTSLEAQEYKFLKAILNRNGNNISFRTIMKQIKSTCKPELTRKISYGIKSKIKSKLKKISPTILLPPEEYDWVLIDGNYKNNKDSYTQMYLQNFDFVKCFDMLISVKNGYFYTEFRKYKQL